MDETPNERVTVKVASVVQWEPHSSLCKCALDFQFVPHLNTKILTYSLICLWFFALNGPWWFSPSTSLVLCCLIGKGGGVRPRQGGQGISPLFQSSVLENACLNSFEQSQDMYRGWGSSVGITAGCWLNDWGSILVRGNIFLFSTMKLTSRLDLVLRSRMVELYLHSPICLHGIVLN
jgi:hypothetical protein